MASVRGLGLPLTCVGLTCLLFSPPAIGQRFRRGDSNTDGAFNLSDVLRTLGYLYQGSPVTLPCFDAADSNDDGEVDLADAVHSLLFLYVGAIPPPPPLETCGEDPTDDPLGCETFDLCPAPEPPPPQPPFLDPLPSSTREAAIQLSGGGIAGLLVRVTGGSGPAPIEAQVDAGGRFSLTVPLKPNRLNRLFAVAVDPAGRVSPPATSQLVQDMQPPDVHVDEPTDGATIMASSITVTGRVSDILSGFLGLLVTVNGVQAEIAIGIGTNGTFERLDVPLEPGANTIHVEAADALGNIAARDITVTRTEPPPGSDRLEIVSGNRQPGRPIHATLPEPIVVRARSEGGSPLAGRWVTFRVTRSDGRLASAATVPPDERSLSLTSLTREDGTARAFWTLGSDAGRGNNRVRVTGAGLAGEALFCASASPGPPAQINIGSGNSQQGEAGGPAAEALRAWVSDGCNGVPGVPVTFRVARGGGKVNGATSATVATGPTGHAETSFLFGPEGGNQTVTASIAGSPAAPAVFQLRALLRDATRPTAIVGLVLDNANQPIGGAGVLLEVPGHPHVQTTTGLDGRFRLEAQGAGAASLQVEGSFATRLGGAGGRDIPPGSFPALTYEVVLVPNAENTLPRPVLLPPLDPANAAIYNGTSAVTLRVQGIDGLEMTVAAGTTVTLRDGRKVGPANPGAVTLSLNQVHHDDVPMPMTDGAAPPFAWTLQPAGARFDPPVRVRYPNLSALPPGAIANFLSFNHDTGKFEVVSTGTVSIDGGTIESDPGAGIPVSGWGCNCPPYSVSAPVLHCAVNVEPKEQVACLGQPVKLTAVGGPGPGTLTWLSSGTPSTGSKSSTDDLAPVLLEFETSFSSTGEKPITVLWTCATGEVKTATAKVLVADLRLHPVNDDFYLGFLSDYAGRVLISTLHDDVYYTEKKTTIADTPAQTQDAKVTITAHLMPATQFEGKTVFFRVTTPDPDDSSPYESGTLGGDNRDPAVLRGALSAPSAMAQKATINGAEVAAAEVVLSITSRYSGDNYQVEASLDSNFKVVCSRTAVLTAWKRIYLEQDNMYAKGATLTADFIADADMSDDILTVDDTSDFTVGASVRVFSPTTSVGAVVTSMTAQTLTVSDLPLDFLRHSGVKLLSDDTTLSAGTTLLTAGYGEEPDGADGGTFVEHILGFAGSGPIPHYKSFPTDTEAFTFCKFWFQNKTAKDNIHQLVAADQHVDMSLGTSDDNLNISFVTTGNFRVDNKDARVAETVVHELAHLFSVANGHVDMEVNARNHENTDECVMSYNRVRDNNIVEFDLDCIHDIRDAVDPR